MRLTDSDALDTMSNGQGIRTCEVAGRASRSGDVESLKMQTSHQTALRVVMAFAHRGRLAIA